MDRSRVALMGLLVAVSLGWVSGVAASPGEGFSDSAGSVHRPGIDALGDLDVFEGTECGEGLFCPQDSIHRWVIAVWLVRVLDEVPVVASGGSRFADVDPERWWAPYVERLAELGVTQGCATEPLRFCPDQAVTRAQMATFLVGAFGLEEAHAAGFADTSGNIHESSIDALAAAGITAGCATGPPRFCPNQPVTRGQMATFLARATGLVEVPDPAAEPSGKFAAVASGYHHTCGLRVEGTIACWGTNWFEDVVSPEGLYTAVTVGRNHSCGLGVDHTVTCWTGYRSSSGVPDGEFTTISTSAGGFHSCGLRKDQTVACWGSNGEGQTDSPEGQFMAVTAGERHSCALRTDGTATCWGWDKAGATNPPGGVFTSISSGGSIDGGHTCALKPDQTAVCWGNNSKGHGFVSGQTDAPRGKFISVTAGYDHTCGIRPDRSLTCWGNNPYGGTDAPAGEFTAVSPGFWYTCGLRTDETITCWGHDHLRATAPPDTDEQFTAVEVSSGWNGDHACALKTDQTIVCWGADTVRRENPPAGKFTSLSSGQLHTCGIRTDGTVTCWGGWGRVTTCIIYSDRSDCRTYWEHEPPKEQFSAVSSGYSYSCGLRTDGTVACWGTTGRGSPTSDIPAETFPISSGHGHSCGIRADQTVTCWGTIDEKAPEAPDGKFASISSGWRYSCGVRTDQTVTCWGNHRQTERLDGAFTAVAAAGEYPCGIRTDGTVTCDHWRFNAPEGTYTAISGGYAQFCGIRIDGTINCWGRVPVPPPDGVNWIT